MRMNLAWQPPDPVPCPECQKTAGVVIVRGMPGAELMALTDEGRIALSGCVVTDQQPDRQCRECHAEWQSALRR